MNQFLNLNNSVHDPNFIVINQVLLFKKWEHHFFYVLAYSKNNGHGMKIKKVASNKNYSRRSRFVDENWPRDSVKIQEKRKGVVRASLPCSI